MTVPMTDITQQDIEVWVNGPDKANRMFIVNGIARIGLGASALGGAVDDDRQTFTVLVGPVLTNAQFIRAVATAAPNGIEIQGREANNYQVWVVNEVDADFDDETGQTQLRIEVEVHASGLAVVIKSISFQATILAAL